MEINNVKLVELVADNECLWRRTNTGYRDKKFKHIVWEEIAAELESTTKQCKIRWKTLRDKYQRQKRLQPSKNGKPQKQWKMALNMSFLDNNSYLGCSTNNTDNDYIYSADYEVASMSGESSTHKRKMKTEENTPSPTNNMDNDYMGSLDCEVPSTSSTKSSKHKRKVKTEEIYTIPTNIMDNDYIDSVDYEVSSTLGTEHSTHKGKLNPEEITMELLQILKKIYENPQPNRSNNIHANFINLLCEQLDKIPQEHVDGVKLELLQTVHAKTIQFKN